MDYIELGATGLRVAPLCLGTVNFGTSTGEADAFAQMDALAAAGGNFVDTAHVYGDWDPGPRGASERVIGAWMRKTGMRDQTVIATKGAHPRLETMGVPRVTPACIAEDVRESLDCLGTSVMDLYLLHRDDPAVPVGELVDALEAHVSAGEIRAYGCSNWTLDRIKEAQAYAAARGFSGFTCNQLMWSLADISYANRSSADFVPMDAETYAYHTETGLAAMAYMSLSKAYFSRKQAGEALPENLERLYGQGESPRIYQELCRLSEEYGVSIASLCLAALMHNPFAATPIASFETMEQLRQGLESCALPVPVEELKKLHGMKKFVVK